MALQRGRPTRQRARALTDTENVVGAGLCWLTATHDVPDALVSEYQALKASVYLATWHGRRLNRALCADLPDEAA